MTQQKIINDKIECLNIYYKNRSHAWSKKIIKISYDCPYLIQKNNTHAFPFVFIAVMGHIAQGFIPAQVFNCFIIIINYSVMTINETTYQHTLRVGCVQIMMLPTTDA